jgi:predicted HicB family RNase H-like nuclease
MSPNEEPDSEVRVTLRMPGPLHQRVKALADRDRRSLNNMLVVLIERGLSHGDNREEGPG